MTDVELAPFVGKQVEVTLVDGRSLRGRFCSFEARIMGMGQYAVATPRLSDPVPGGEQYAAIHYAELITSIRETGVDEGTGHA